MTTVSSFAYAQARLQARHGQRPGEHVWRQLQGTVDLANYLLAVRRTTLRQWVLGMNVSHSIHEIEQSLRDQLRDYVNEIARWLPAEWHASFYWAGALTDLPALQYLLAGNVAPGWMMYDRVLQEFASEEPELRLEAIMNSHYSHIAELWQKGLPLTDAWLDHWLHLLPGKARKEEGIRQLIRLYQETLMVATENAPNVTSRRRFSIYSRLSLLFRQYSFQATAAFAHLGLVALDLEQLRTGLVTRALFPEKIEALR
jgi:hypothetical protein